MRAGIRFGNQLVSAAGIRHDRGQAGNSVPRYARRLGAPQHAYAKAVDSARIGPRSPSFLREIPKDSIEVSIKRVEKKRCNN